MMFPRPEWEKFRERIAALPMSAQWWKRVFLGNAMDVELDGTGRVLISPELREAAGISRDTVLLGMGNHFELWDKATYDAEGSRGDAGRDARRLQGLHLLKEDGGLPMATHHRLVERSSRFPSQQVHRMQLLCRRDLWARRAQPRLILSRLGQAPPGGLRPDVDAIQKPRASRMRVFPSVTRAFTIWASCRRKASRAS
jgi:MraZ protein